MHWQRHIFIGNDNSVLYRTIVDFKANLELNLTRLLPQRCQAQVIAP
jgi:hypothetical protein